jgi:hypothetical protein
VFSSVEHRRRACLFAGVATPVATPGQERESGAPAHVAAPSRAPAPKPVRTIGGHLYQYSNVGWSWLESALGTGRRHIHGHIIPRPKKICYGGSAPSPRPYSIIDWVPLSTAPGWPVGVAVWLPIGGGAR